MVEKASPVTVEPTQLPLILPDSKDKVDNASSNSPIPQENTPIPTFSDYTEEELQELYEPEGHWDH